MIIRAKAAAALLALWGSVASAEVTYSYYSLDDPSTSLSLDGTGKGETFQVGIAILPSADLAGKTITEMRVPVAISESLSPYICWISSSLELEKVDGRNQFVPELTSEEITPTEPMEGSDFAELVWTLEEPFTIPADTLYVGYEVTVKKLDDVSKTALVIAKNGGLTGGLWMRATRSHTRFTELSAEYQGVMPITVALAGDFSFAAATVDVASTLKVKRGDVELPVTLHNRCSQPITDIDYAYTIGGVSGSQHLELPSPLPTHYDYPFAAVLPLGEVDEVGSYPLTLNITRVNGVRNTADGSYEGNIDVRYFVAKKRPLLEEFTGTWCTFCPRGYVGLEKMAEFYPDDFIAIAYHVDDPMVMKNGLPYTPGGYPLAKMDRVEWMDPYFGNNQEEVDFGIESTWLSYCNKGADMDLEVDAEWTAEGYIHITSTVTWAITPEADKNYRINYVLVADGLTGTELGWYQKNYYSHQATTPLYMDLFVEGDSYVGGLTFNHVGVYCASNSGLTPAIQGSTMEANVAFTHEYTLNPARAVDTNNESLIQDMNQLRVVAMWLDEETGEVLNAAKVEVPAFSTAINKVKGDATVESVVFYNLQGIPVATPAGGIFIRSERMTDGSLRNQKISIR